MTTPFYAVHIGVDTYAHDDVPPLSGAAEDVRRWHHYTTGAAHVGAPRGHVRCLTGAEATREAILDAARWLGEKVGPTGSGLLTFSGHGTALAGVADHAMASTAALCPHDAVPDEASTFLTTDDLATALGDAAPNVTAVLDACYSKAPGSPARALGGSDAAPQHPETHLRVLLAAAPWQEAMELQTGGQWHGAFTFALLTLLEQWSVVHEPEAVWARVSYGDLMFRTRDLLEVLGVSQQPVLLGRPRLGMVPFLRPGNELANGETRAAPDAPRHGEQLGFGNTGGFAVVVINAFLQLPSGSYEDVTVANVLVTDNNIPTTKAPWDSSQDLQKNWEYWFAANTLSSSQRAALQGFELQRIRLSNLDNVPTTEPLLNRNCKAPYGDNPNDPQKPGAANANWTAAFQIDDGSVAMQLRFDSSNKLQKVRFYAKNNGEAHVRTSLLGDTSTAGTLTMNNPAGDSTFQNVITQAPPN